MNLFGLLNIDKPAGWTSRDAVNRIDSIVREVATNRHDSATRKMRRPKVGHAGTLDPLATGVLVVCIGSATRLVEYIHRMPKRYTATFLLGQRSDSDDTECEITILEHSPVRSRSEIEDAAQEFVGEIDQMPPRYSAVKIGGQRAYRLARSGRAIDLRARRVRIDSIRVVDYAYPRLELNIECGSGTYIRSIGRDLARSLGTEAVLCALRRDAIGRFLAADSVPPSALSPNCLGDFLRPAIEAVPDLSVVSVSEAEATALSNGIAIDSRNEFSLGQEFAAVGRDNRLVAILKQKNDGRLWPFRNFDSRGDDLR